MPSLRELFEHIVSKTPDIVSSGDNKILAAAADYAAEDVLSENATAASPFLFSNMAKKDDGAGEIIKAILFLSVADITPRISLFLFNRPPTSVLTDNVANTAVSLADHPAFEGQIDFVATETLGTGGSVSVVTTSTSGNLPLPFKCVTRSLWGIAVTRDAITGEAVGMTLNIKLQARRF